jgi:hypothetical protein
VSDPPRRDLAERSDALLDALNELRRLEAQKRREPISSPEFEDLAAKVEAKSQEIFRLAGEQARLGSEVGPTTDSIEEVAAEESGENPPN